MNRTEKRENINVKKCDADEFIKEVLEKIPENKKMEALRLLEGFALSESVTEKAG